MDIIIIIIIIIILILIVVGIACLFVLVWIFEFAKEAASDLYFRLSWWLLGPPYFYSDFADELYDGCSLVEKDADVAAATAPKAKFKLSPEVKQKVIDYYVRGATIAVVKMLKDR